MGERSENPVRFELHATIEVLQMEHGLRHASSRQEAEAANYAEYRRFVSKRLARLRHKLKVTNGKKTFQRKDVSAEMATSGEHLLIPTLLAERAWAASLELKYSKMVGEREDRRAAKRLRKAIIWSAQLVSLCEAVADETTQVEARTYDAWLRGLTLETSNRLEESLLALEVAHANYAKLGLTGRAAEALGALKRVQYRLTGTVTYEDEVEEEAEAETVEWCGNQLKLPRQASFDPAVFNDLPETDEGIAKRLAELDDLLRTVDGLLAAKVQYTKLELMSRRLEGVLDARTRAWQRAALQRTAAHLLGNQDASASAAENLVHLYESLMQLARDMKQLPGVQDSEDDSLSERLDARLARLKAAKCYYLAETFFDRSAIDKATALFKHASYLSERAALEADAIGDDASAKDATEIGDTARGGLVRCKLHAAAAAEASDQPAPPAAGIVCQLRDRRADHLVVDATLDPPFALAHVPPKPRPLPCKPFFFDIAHDHLD
ncbi:hypothetical protein CTAYLR_003397 [Chrysophaeum taylorii]|uniref:Signal recognition particle subunit SRP68 n=1 Tax=Chrysophaeum taylorii TaxID=2483200 RepID=A0AAD7U7P5_9STRA|nr:hypothetical protein CTAYLR_003397 [Chrysophaeum taylorii]